MTVDIEGTLAGSGPSGGHLKLVTTLGHGRRALGLWIELFQERRTGSKRN